MKIKAVHLPKGRCMAVLFTLNVQITRSAISFLLVFIIFVSMLNHFNVVKKDMDEWFPINLFG